MNVTWMDAWSTFRCFCKGGTNNVQPYWKLATAIMLRTLKKRISQRLSKIDDPGACRVELSAMLTPPIWNSAGGRYLRRMRPVFPTSGTLPEAQLPAPREFEPKV